MKKNEVTHLIGWTGVILMLAGLDLVSKFWAQSSFQGTEVWIPLLLEFELVYNPGIAFGAFAHSQQWFQGFIIALSWLAIAYFVYWFLTEEHRSSWFKWGLALMIAGALGNLYERMVQGVVTDFLHLKFMETSMFVFNVADAYISVGLGLLLVHHIWFEKSLKSEQFEAVGDDETGQSNDSTKPPVSS